MGSFKALVLAGVASLAAMSTASAADLLLPPPPPVAPAIIPVDFGSNFYLRGDVGVGAADLRTRPSSFQTNVPDARFENSSLDDSGFVDIGVGYRFNNYFRADITGEYRTAAHFSANESYNVGAFFPDQFGNPAPNGARAYDNYSGSIRSVVGLVNGYVDLGTWYCITPFVGAGVGVANINVKNVTDISYGSGAINGLGNGGGGYSFSHNQTNFAFALMAGIDFAVTRNVSLELGYRYLNLGSASSAPITCASAGSCPNEVQHYKIDSQDIRLGLRYAFDAPAAPPQYPLVRKYANTNAASLSAHHDSVRSATREVQCPTDFSCSARLRWP